MTLCLAINYGGRAELADAMRKLAIQVKQGELAPDAIDESTIDDALTTAGMPDPDLLIRTAAEMRVNDFLLWQIAYAELTVTADVLKASSMRRRCTGTAASPGESGATAGSGFDE